MSTSPTLEDFVKTYIQNKAKSSSKESYSDWLISNGINSEKIYSDSIRDITGDYERAKSGYGSLGESLAELGLTASGYSDYLAANAYSTMQKRKMGAKNKYAENEAENRSGYSNYLREISDAASKAYKSVVTAISNEGIMDYEKAYNYAVGAGLSEDDAKLAAKTASDIVRKSIRQSIIKAIVSKGFNKKQAKDYSLALGLSEAEAEELGKYAAEINEYEHFDSEYLEYLKNKAESEKNASK